MNDRIPEVPPVIAALPNDENRPVWSVMIPTYNCIEFLRDAISSVLIQDRGQETMQIEVVDDCSTDGDVKALVQEIGKGRVLFYKLPENRGSLRNFETCINRARGKYVHLLHGDDCIRPGFYNEIERLYTAYPEVGAAFTKSTHIDEKGNIAPEFKYDTLPKTAGILEDFLIKIATANRLQPPSIVVKRSVYEKLGSFFAVKYGEDWEMWTRIAASYKIAYSPECLALYRAGHGTNITSQSLLLGQNIVDIAKVINIIQNYLPEDKKRQIRNESKKSFSIHYAMASVRIYPGNKKTAFAQARGAWKMHKNLKAAYYIGRLFLMHLSSKIGIAPAKKTSSI